MKKVIIAAGGTGGHIFPALSLGKYLRESGMEIVFIGRRNSLEEKIYQKESFKIEYIDIAGFKGKNLKNKIIAVIKVMKSFINCFKIMKKYKPDVVIGFGGYISFPVMFVSKIMGIKNAICEQNSIMGFSNRLSTFFVKKIFLNFKNTQKIPSIFKKEICGNFLKKEILELNLNSNVKNKILIFGGSQGAQKLNNLIVKIIDKLISLNKEIIHITGKKNYETVKNAYIKKGVIEKIKVIPFTTEMEQFYNNADIVISRAGATSITEFFALKLKAILIPFPYATDNHQWFNGCEYAKTGKAVVLDEKYLTEEKLLKWIEFFSKNNERFKGDWEVLGDPYKAHEKILKWITS